MRRTPTTTPHAAVISTIALSTETTTRHRVARVPLEMGQAAHGELPAPTAVARRAQVAAQALSAPAEPTVIRAERALAPGNAPVARAVLEAAALALMGAAQQRHHAATPPLEALVDKATAAVAAAPGNAPVALSAELEVTVGAAEVLAGDAVPVVQGVRAEAVLAADGDDNP